MHERTREAFNDLLDALEAEGWDVEKIDEFTELKDPFGISYYPIERTNSGNGRAAGARISITAEIEYGQLQVGMPEAGEADASDSNPFKEREPDDIVARSGLRYPSGGRLICKDTGRSVPVEDAGDAELNFLECSRCGDSMRFRPPKGEFE